MIKTWFVCDSSDALPSMRLDVAPRIGERLAIEDVVMISGHPTTRIRWFDVTMVVHSIALKSDDEDNPTLQRLRDHGVTIHLEYRHG